ncbi:MAG: bifunctional diaminohydroxyphosphoribosylaminopyrimidine deaminase/5-amino-6-(5-phosphoribosylamino)uracil reductase RibD [Planctomycetes bacterium]|nr:bifunctional diaminohydroxyphosphoribosylaminopyrimidine deaminase/5-amino-6-(5-phosphoribosylamino)uracil reductase RibD [Planctomycetota bacterium]MBL7043245.1 bifunctional diaminohydroxyphosphoribosylaminopyrimidine deaminase/5-amino-6-(5-phosphoribosylamino)uracil reductase RibD [Pirellulaceae bacterium]
MMHAIKLARRGEGAVEPNPMVGCVIVRDDEVVGEGWHQQFGGPHAEVLALNDAGDDARGATMSVTLEPCCHQGKTPPCADAMVRSGIKHVVVAQRDPFPKVSGGGLRVLREAGITVDVGVCEGPARRLNAPYLKLVETGKPWVIAKWAMSLDGKIATRTGNSQWISNEASRAVVHKIRGRVDAIIVGSGTARVDDPMLTARPPGPRVATRIVLDSAASLSVDSQLVQTTDTAPVLVVATSDAPAENVTRLMNSGCEVLVCDGTTPAERLRNLLADLGQRRMTNVLVEGGATLLGTLRDADAIDEAHVFIAPKIVGGANALSPIGGSGLEIISNTKPLADWTVTELDGDIYAKGRILR